MSSSPPRQRGALLVLGSGPGIGIAVAKLFAQRGFRRVILCARNAERLAKEVEEVKSVAEEDTEVSAITVDLGSAGSVKGALAELEGSLGGIGGADDEEGKGKGRLEAVLFNAARIGPSKLWEFGEEGLRNDFEISVTSLYTIASWAVPKLVETAKDSAARPSFLVTSGGLAKDPYPHVFSLAMVKAAQYNFVWSLYKAYAPQGVHCALIVVQGYVKPEAQVTTPKNIAEKTWELFEQERGKFDLDVDIVDPEYKERRKELEAQQQRT